METPQGSDTLLQGSTSSMTLQPGFLYPSIQINGRKVIGPPQNWEGPPPSTACELFIKKIPRNLAEESLIPHLQRFGQIYEFRLMMDFSEHNRGFGYVKYTTEEAANRTMEVLNHLYVVPGKLLQFEPSYDKCRLYVGNIPRHLPREEIERVFSETFPNMSKLLMHTRITDGSKNRGFVFIDFRNHQDALDAKKMTTPGRLRKWGNDLKIVWANPERKVDQDTLNHVKSLFVRNIDLSVTNRVLFNLLQPIVKRTEILKISRVREFAFLDFETRSAAEKVLNSLQGVQIKGYPLHFEWALPPSEDSVHLLKNHDFDAVLRLKCIANSWNTPIIIFGRVFDAVELQYAAIMIRNHDKVHAFFFEIYTKGLSDIQARLCEVVVVLIEKCNGLPMSNFVIKVKDDNIHLVGVIADIAKLTFVKATQIHVDMFLHCNEIVDLCKAVHRLSLISHNEIYATYIRTIQYSGFSYMELLAMDDRILGCLNPNYRQKPPLKYQLDNSQIILALCSMFSFTNYIFPNVQTIYNLRDEQGPNTNTAGIVYSILNLMPGHFAQSKNGSLILNAIRFGYSKFNNHGRYPIAYKPIDYKCFNEIIGNNSFTC